MDYLTLVNLTIMLALVQFLYFTLRTGLTREKYKIDAPKTTGHETWERIFRVQQNTMEQLVIFIPGMLFFAHYVSAGWALLPGVAFLIGRQIFSHYYVNNPPKRAPGVALSLIANVGLILGSIVGIVLDLF